MVPESLPINKKTDRFIDKHIGIYRSQVKSSIVFSPVSVEAACSLAKIPIDKKAIRLRKRIAFMIVNYLLASFSI